MLSAASTMKFAISTMKLAVYTIKSEDEKSKIRDELHIVSAYYMKNTDAEVGIAIIQN
ncbi:MAG: hypothetical protein SGI89_08600 [bacterium]|nr:hypothetical protein [bacterium]